MSKRHCHLMFSPHSCCVSFPQDVLCSRMSRSETFLHLSSPFSLLWSRTVPWYFFDLYDPHAVGGSPVIWSFLMLFMIIFRSYTVSGDSTVLFYDALFSLLLPGGASFQFVLFLVMFTLITWFGCYLPDFFTATLLFCPLELMNILWEVLW